MHWSERRGGGLVVLLVLLFAPATGWAHGDLQGLAAVFVGLFLGGAMAALLLPCIVALIVLLVKKKHTRGARIFARVVQGLAIGFQVIYPLVSIGLEHNDAGLAIGGICSAMLLLFTGAAFVLGQILVSKSLRAESAHQETSVGESS